MLKYELWILMMFDIKNLIPVTIALRTGWILAVLPSLSTSLTCSTRFKTKTFRVLSKEGGGRAWNKASLCLSHLQAFTEVHVQNKWLWSALSCGMPICFVLSEAVSKKAICWRKSWKLERSERVQQWLSEHLDFFSFFFLFKPEEHELSTIQT